MGFHSHSIRARFDKIRDIPPSEYVMLCIEFSGLSAHIVCRSKNKIFVYDKIIFHLAVMHFNQMPKVLIAFAAYDFMASLSVPKAINPFTLRLT